MKQQNKKKLPPVPSPVRIHWFLTRLRPIRNSPALLVAQPRSRLIDVRVGRPRRNLAVVGPAPLKNWNPGLDLLPENMGNNFQRRTRCSTTLKAKDKKQLRKKSPHKKRIEEADEEYRKSQTDHPRRSLNRDHSHFDAPRNVWSVDALHQSGTRQASGCSAAGPGPMPVLGFDRDSWRGT